MTNQVTRTVLNHRLEAVADYATRLGLIPDGHALILSGSPYGWALELKEDENGGTTTAPFFSGRDAGDTKREAFKTLNTLAGALYAVCQIQGK